MGATFLIPLVHKPREPCRRELRGTPSPGLLVVTLPGAPQRASETLQHQPSGRALCPSTASRGCLFPALLVCPPPRLLCPSHTLSRPRPVPCSPLSPLLFVTRQQVRWLEGRGAQQCCSWAWSHLPLVSARSCDGPPLSEQYEAGLASSFHSHELSPFNNPLCDAVPLGGQRGLRTGSRTHQSSLQVWLLGWLSVSPDLLVGGGPHSCPWQAPLRLSLAGPRASQLPPE